ncbi:MAG: D-glycero-beta-D-manno-heptose-7-phosphate kinase [Spirosomataceae bacterium]
MNSIEKIFESFNKLRVLVIGDVMLDSYVWGKVERISPEAPVPVVSVKSRELRLGGAGNVLLNLQSLGAEAFVCTVVGNDNYGQKLHQILRERGLNCEGLIQSADRVTTVKERVIAGNQHIVRIDTEMEEVISEQERAKLIDKARELIPSCDVVLFEDYDKGVLDESSIQEIVDFAREHEVPTVVDPKKRNFMAYRNVTLFKPNLKELREGFKRDFDIDNRERFEEVVQELVHRLSAKGALITQSERGVFILSEGEKHHIQAHKRNVIDVSGAGDTVISIAACCVALGLSPYQTAALSNLGGGLVCEHVGAVPIDKELLLREALRLHGQN